MEDFLHYVWKYNLYDKNLVTTKGERIEVLDVGLHNHDSGPDFFNAKIKIDEKVWVGNIEIHTSSDNWEKHGHHKDKNYDSVILHLTGNANAPVIASNGRIIPECVLKYPSYIEDNMHLLLKSNIEYPCSGYIKSMLNIKLKSWMDFLLIERMERKTKDVEKLLEKFINSWEDVFYVLIARSFGFGLNSDIFERLGKSLPLSFIKKHADSVFQIEALLFGQAGMLNQEPLDDYQKKLKLEYAFLRNKFGLIPLDEFLFKKMRTRPSSFPQIRIAQLASLLYSHEHLFNQILYAKDIGTIRLIFHCNASEYWQTHYSFGIEAPKKSKYLGDCALDSLIINSVCPILFCYGKKIQDEHFCDKSFFFLESMKAENNVITRTFGKLGVKIKNACDSQACIQLKREYCEKKKCLVCRIGHTVLSVAPNI